MDKAKKKEPLVSAYIKMEEMIGKTVWAFIRHYQFNRFYADWLQEAHLRFVTAMYEYDGSMDLEKYIRIKIWNHLLDHSKAEIRRNGTKEQINLNDLPSNEHSEFDLDKFKWALSNDGRMVIRVLFEYFDKPVICKRLEPSKIKQLRDYFLGMGWTRERVQMAFLNIEGELAKW